MPDLADTIADAFAVADEHAEKIAPAYAKRIRQLLSDADERDADLFEDAFMALHLDLAETDIVLDELLDVASKDRDALWYSTFSTILAASKAQALTELVYRPMAEHGIDVAPSVSRGSRDLDSANKKTLAKAGIGKARWGAARERRRG